MIALPPQIRVFLYRLPTDMRNYAVRAFMQSNGHPLELISSFWALKRLANDA
jgi:hypothetical protein